MSITVRIAVVHPHPADRRDVVVRNLAVVNDHGLVSNPGPSVEAVDVYSNGIRNVDLMIIVVLVTPS